jgi:hypothetical protein
MSVWLLVAIANIPRALVKTCLSSFPSGLDKIEFLQSHENVDIYRRALRIIENYFGSQEDDRVQLDASAPSHNPSAPHQGGNFSF